MNARFSNYDVIVVGGGVIGCTIGWRLGQTGRRVLLLERGRLGAEASSAAAGMLGAQLEVSSPGPFFRLCLESRRLYPAFAEALLEETGIDIQLSPMGILRLAADAAEAQRLRQTLEWQQACGGRGEWWEEGQVRQAERVLAATAGALYLPDDHNVSAPLLARAVAAAAGRRCEVVEGDPVWRVTPAAGGVQVQTASAVYHAETAVIAAGAWSEALLAEWDWRPRIQPVKGQILSVRPQPGASVRHTVFADGVYLVPKRDGSIVVGATEEHGAGFDKALTADGVGALLDLLRRVAPGLRNARLERAWSGLRPGSPEGRPLIGPVPGVPGVWAATGHFRNGILLAPVTAEMVRRGLDGEAWPDSWQSFRPRPGGEVTADGSPLERPATASP
ncbi:MAG: glycine oxidase ThiO [Alicyclobacillaceae bacterium]|nr:glycine oxidase ThiO [Alicyclobacillaceae bacterium]